MADPTVTEDLLNKIVHALALIQLESPSGEVEALPLLREHGQSLVEEIRRLRATLATNAKIERSSVGRPAQAAEQMRMLCLAVVQRGMRYGHGPEATMIAIEGIRVEDVVNKVVER